MSGMWRKTLVYLGLVEEGDETDEQQVTPDQTAPAHLAAPPPPPPPPPRRARREGQSRPRRAGDGASVRPLPNAEPRSTHVRPLNAAMVRVGIVRAASFDDAEEVGERYRGGQPVLLDLAGVDAKVGRRLLDFVSGVTFALRGRIAPAGERAFLLLPHGLDIPVDERRRLGDLGYQVLVPGDS
ncbi:MAG: cell division protein SepF [Nitriliruptorales bacterium]